MTRFHIYKEHGYWHVLDTRDAQIYSFNTCQEAIFAAKKGIDMVKNFNLRGLE